MKKIQDICDFSNQTVGGYQSGFYSQENSGLVGFLKIDTDIRTVEVFNILYITYFPKNSVKV
jgi:hypothetical protein